MGCSKSIGSGCMVLASYAMNGREIDTRVMGATLKRAEKAKEQKYREPIKQAMEPLTFILMAITSFGNLGKPAEDC